MMILVAFFLPHSLVLCHTADVGRPTFITREKVSCQETALHSCTLLLLLSFATCHHYADNFGNESHFYTAPV